MEKNCEFRGILTILRWFLKLSHSAVAVPQLSSTVIMYAYMSNMMSDTDSSQTLYKIPLHSINLTHLILMTNHRPFSNIDWLKIP